MEKKSIKQILSYILCITLTVAMAFYAAGCNGKAQNEAQNETSAASVFTPLEDGSTAGEGEKEFSLTVADKDGRETKITVRTDRETVGEALQELLLIDGEASEYGLYVKTVNGITADYEKDGVYWAFYVDGAYAEKGVDSEIVADGGNYMFKIE